MKSQSVLEAVQNEKTVSKRGILQKIFAVWFDAFVYNQIWEDPRVDLQALQLNGNSRILTISSGGCNALNYLLANPQKVTAVDLNRQHVYLLELKIAALKSLPEHDDFFEFFGFGKGAKTIENYRNIIAPELSENARNFWESKTFSGAITNRRRINFFSGKGLYAHSRSGYFLRFFHFFARLVGARPEKVLEARTTAEQLELYERHIEPFFSSPLIKIVGKLPVTMFGLGIPPQQYDELKKDLRKDETVIDLYKKRVKRLAVDFPADENYFAWQAFASRYDTKNRRAIPDYLKRENYEKLKPASGKIEAKIGSVTNEIKNQPKNTFNRFVFLDAQDWMNRDALVELWQAIHDFGETGSRIIFRTAGADSPVEKHLPNNLREKFIYEKELSAELFKQDRAAVYGGFHLYILK